MAEAEGMLLWAGTEEQPALPQETRPAAHIPWLANNNRAIKGIVTPSSDPEVLHLCGALVQASQRMPAKTREVYLETGLAFLLAYKQNISVQFLFLNSDLVTNSVLYYAYIYVCKHIYIHTYKYTHHTKE